MLCHEFLKQGEKNVFDAEVLANLKYLPLRRLLTKSVFQLCLHSILAELPNDLS